MRASARNRRHQLTPSQQPAQPCVTATLGSSRDVGNGPKPPRTDHTRARSARCQAPQLSRSAVRLGAGPQPSRKTRTKRKKAYGAHPKKAEPSHWPPRQLEGRAARAAGAVRAGCGLVTRAVRESVGLRGEVVAAAAVPVLVL